MNSMNSESVVLTRGDEIVHYAPSADDMVSLMKTMQSENGMKGAPELCLEFSSDGKQWARNKPTLLVIRVFHRNKSSRWIVDFCIPAVGASSKLLASRPPAQDDFEVWTCCGVISRFRTECVIDDMSILRQAIDWFLNHHSACPALTWVQYDDAVRDEDNSAY